jgi:hypothetical protein
VTSDGVSSSSCVGWTPGEHVTGLEINLDAEQCRVLDLGLHVMRVSPKPVPNIRRSSSHRCAPSSTWIQAISCAASDSRRRHRPPLHGGALQCQQWHKKAAICSCFVFLKEPSDGLEPSTPSLPWRFRGVTRVHARSPATQFLLQIALLQAVEMRREASRVSFLMCLFCVRDPSSKQTTPSSRARA